MLEYTTPEFLKGRSPEDYMDIVYDLMPADIDLSAGGHAWNLTVVSALIASELCEYAIPEAIKVMVPDWSYGTYLYEHAKARGLKPRSATAATGTLKITGAVGTVIPAGSLFSTSSVNDEPSVDYETTESVTIPESGSVTVEVVCTQTGTVGNTAVATVIHVGSKITGITSVTNEKAITGGTEDEDDESIRERISEYDQSLGDSFVGSPADYKRWAESVDGVGTANVIPAQDTSGLVTIVLIDANGDPATEAICDDVYNYIMSPDDQYARLAPTGASLSVVAPTTVDISVKATVELAENATIESVKEEFLKNIIAYLPEAMGEKEVKYSRIARELSKVSGVYDYKDVQIGTVNDGYGTSNISVSNTQLPVITADNIILTAGTV